MVLWIQNNWASWPGLGQQQQRWGRARRGAASRSQVEGDQGGQSFYINFFHPRASLLLFIKAQWLKMTCEDRNVERNSSPGGFFHSAAVDTSLVIAGGTWLSSWHCQDCQLAQRLQWGNFGANQEMAVVEAISPPTFPFLCWLPWWRQSGCKSPPFTFSIGIKLSGGKWRWRVSSFSLFTVLWWWSPNSPHSPPSRPPEMGSAPMSI